MPLNITVESLDREHLGAARWGGTPTDGDTPTVALNIRMVNVDAPEVHYPGNRKPSRQDAALAGLLANRPEVFTPQLRDYLSPKLEGNAGTRQMEWGKKSRDAYDALAKELLQFDPEKERYRAKVHITIGSEPFDRFQRLLAYVAPMENIAAKRKTFNLMLAEQGWVVNYLIYPNLPKRDDIIKLQKAVAKARKKELGMWADPLLLAGYEFRNLVDTASKKSNGPKRHCADISTGRLHLPEDYFTILPENRLFIDKRDLKKAQTTLGLKWA
ncbi:MAG: thermonuclease family protein [Chlorobi bacterium]|nr:thermonuclease family protein [Chlorobiota bacterium]MBX7215322.1 thermonuclease family protein [Candidatus Kapabacteria bacterium]